MALDAPNLLKLEKWVYQIDNLNANLPSFPQGKYIICGYGRMGQHIYRNLKVNHIEAEFVEIDRSKVGTFAADELMHITYGNADDKELLLSVGIEDAVAIISATNDDTTNLSVLATAKKLNPNIMTIARENEMDDLSIFENAKIDHIFMPSRILINKTTNALIRPLSDKFIRLICKKDDAWASKLVKDLIQTIDEKPLLYELRIDRKNAPPEVYDAIKEENKEIELGIFNRSLYNREQKNNIIALLLKNENNEIKLLPDEKIVLKENDEILFACDENAKNDIEYIAQNLYEFHYAYTGEEKKDNIYEEYKMIILTGPCVLEDRDTVMKIAEKLKPLSEDKRVDFYFKASFDKANRTSLSSYRGPGLDEGLKLFQEVKEQFGYRLVTDIHESYQAKPASEVLDILQIPAFLCRQTDLLVEAAKTNCKINIKKRSILSR